MSPWYLEDSSVGHDTAFDARIGKYLRPVWKDDMVVVFLASKKDVRHMVVPIVWHRSAHWDQSEWCRLRSDSTLFCQAPLLQPRLRSYLTSEDLLFQHHRDLLSSGPEIRFSTLLALPNLVCNRLTAAMPCVEYSAISIFQPWQSLFVLAGRDTALQIPPPIQL